MLTSRHLAVLQAALQFFLEEMVPHGRDAMRGYFSKPLEQELTVDEVRHLRQFLRKAKIRYLVLKGNQPISDTLYRTKEDATNAAPTSLCHVAVVLISPNP